MSGPRKPKDIENFVPAAAAANFLRGIADKLEKNDAHPDTTVSLALRIRRWDKRWELRPSRSALGRVLGQGRCAADVRRVGALERLQRCGQAGGTSARGLDPDARQGHVLDEWGGSVTEATDATAGEAGLSDCRRFIHCGGIPGSMCSQASGAGCLGPGRNRCHSDGCGLSRDVHPSGRTRTTTQYRIAYDRTDADGITVKSVKVRGSYANAMRFIKLIGPEPWSAFGKKPDDHVCCPGGSYECSCDGVTYAEQSEKRREGLPPATNIRIWKRSVTRGAWSPA